EMINNLSQKSTKYFSSSLLERFTQFALYPLFFSMKTPVTMQRAMIIYISSGLFDIELMMGLFFGEEQQRPGFVAAIYYFYSIAFDWLFKHSSFVDFHHYISRNDSILLNDDANDDSNGHDDEVSVSSQ